MNISVDVKKPFVIEFAGLPAAGKSTAISMVMKSLIQQDYKVEVIPTALAVSPLSHLKHEWIFDAWIMCRKIKKIIESCQNSNQDIIIFDRGLIDTLVWLQWFKNEGHIDDNRFDSLVNFATIPEWLHEIDYLAMFRADFEVALERRGRTGSIVNNTTHKGLDDAYKQFLPQVKSKHHNLQVHEIDTSNLQMFEVHNKIISKLKQCLSL